MNKLKVIKKVLKQTCWKCEGVGYFWEKITDKVDYVLNVVRRVNSEKALVKRVKSKYPHIICDVCNGSGIYKENHYIYINGKYAYDADTLK